MAVQKMQKVALLVSQKEVQNVLAFLQESSSFELIESTADTRAEAPEALKGTEGKLANILFAIRFLSPNAPKKNSLREKLLGDRIEANESQALLALEKDFSAAIDECVDLEEQKNKITARVSRIADLKKALSSWKNFSLPLGFERSTKNVEVRLGNIETKDLLDFSTNIEAIAGAHLHIVLKGEKNTYFLILFAKNSAEEVATHLDTFRFSENDFSEMTGTPAEEIAHLETEKVQLLSDEEKINQRRTQLAKTYLKDMKLAHDALTWRKEKKDAIESSTATKTTVALEGWVPARAFDAVTKGINTITPAFEMTKVEPEEGENAPVQLTGTMAKPFQIVTKFFGLPLGKEMDPTPFVAPFFAIFFGFCLTDAGYGVLLTLSFLVAHMLFPVSKEIKNTFKLLILCGISTTVLGIMFGGYFGLTHAQLPFLVNESTGMFFGQVFDPVEDLVPTIMVLAYALGIVQLLIGVILQGVVRARKGDKIGVLTVTVPTLAMVILTLLWGVGDKIPADIFVIDAAMKTNLGYALLAMLGVLTFSLGPKGNIFVRPVLGSLILANELIGWVSNILSYSRLFALGLATGIIAMSFNQIAVTAAGDLPLYFALPIMIVIILFGHTLNLGLNFIGALVHTARLQFVEFFGRFFEGGATEFTPMSRRSTYMFDATK